MSAFVRVAFFGAVAFVALALLPGCGKKGMWDKYKGQDRKGQQRISHYEINQPNINYPNDDVIVWKEPGRSQRAFLLKPGTKVELLETVDGDKYGTEHIVYRIKTADGREGWVPKPWCKQVYK